MGDNDWTVWRHGGRVNNEWRRLPTIGGEASARRVYERERAKLRQGAVELRDPAGVVKSRTAAPLLRTRW